LSGDPGRWAAWSSNCLVQSGEGRCRCQESGLQHCFAVLLDQPRYSSSLAFSEGLFFSNILQISILKYRFNIEELTDLV